MENILLEIESQMKVVETVKDMAGHYTVEKAIGNLGTDVIYTVEHWMKGSGNTAKENASIILKVNDQLLVKITTEHGFVNMTKPFSSGDKYWEPRKAVRPETDISVVSPRWQEGTGLLSMTKDTESGKATKKLSIYHAANETADNVIRNLCAVITGSKNQAAYREKLRKFNLAQGNKKTYGRDL